MRLFLQQFFSIAPGRLESMGNQTLGKDLLAISFAVLRRHRWNGSSFPVKTHDLSLAFTDPLSEETSPTFYVFFIFLYKKYFICEISKDAEPKIPPSQTILLMNSEDYWLAQTLFMPRAGCRCMCLMGKGGGEIAGQLRSEEYSKVNSVPRYFFTSSIKTLYIWSNPLDRIFLRWHCLVLCA